MFMAHLHRWALAFLGSGLVLLSRKTVQTVRHFLLVATRV
jgi:hypothetical protein